jgi:hypothetical protein
MSFLISIIGIDGSGKSTVTLGLADLAAAELGLTTVAVSDDYWVKTPEEDLFRPGFAPDGKLLVARLDQLFRKIAKVTTHYRRLYPTIKVIQLAVKEWAARRMASHYRPDIILVDGNLLLTSGGWVMNYISAEPDATLGVAPLDPITYLEVLYEYMVSGTSLPPGIGEPILGLKLMRWLYRLDQWTNLGLTQLPDALILLDIAPEKALGRVIARDRQPDGHENLADMTQARVMLRAIAEFFRRRRGDRNTAVIDVTQLSVGQTLSQVVDFIHTLELPRREKRPLPQQAPGSQGEDASSKRERLGISPPGLSQVSTVARKVLTYHYLIRYLLLNLRRGSAYELIFPLSPLGRLSLREGYSAGLMKAIYLQDSRDYGLLDRLFLNHPLHRAVYHRLQVLKREVNKELWRRVANFHTSDVIKVLTAPSGYAFDLLHPLKQIAKSDQARIRPVHILASDLDPDGRIEEDLIAAVQAVGLNLEFVRGDLTSAEIKERFSQAGPFDLVFFVGISSWISKTDLVEHLKLVRTELLAPGGILFTDCFLPQAASISGKYLGYRASYYSPAEFSNLLAYSGFDPANLTWESGPDGIDHVCMARTPPGQEKMMSISSRGVHHALETEDRWLQSRGKSHGPNL